MPERTGQWKDTASTLTDGLEGEPRANHYPQTGVDKDLLVDIGKASVKVPDGFVRTTFVFLNDRVLIDWSRRSTRAYKDMSSGGFRRWRWARILIGLQPRCVFFFFFLLKIFRGC